MSLRNIDWRKFAPLALMLVFPFLGLMYQWINKPDQEVYMLVTALDRATPFVKFFAAPYAVWIFYIYVCLVYFFRKNITVYYRGLLTYIVCALTCYLIYSVFQTTVPRPLVTVDDPFTWLVSYIYNRDLPFNCFPSIHCFSSYMVMRLVWTSSFRNKWNVTLITTMSTLIILSTLFVKQHVILDAVAGILLVEVWLAVMMLIEVSVRESRARQHRQEKRTYGA
ncbi:phosphatase PAP2 family protein [Cohnella pontilimi]|uniref:Phosphatase PAP2 family protein n=1 Tax=Cohnella pontilimi TaxID=2564100 RepID=A0A4U0F7T8_9BACL|nr:phosphatase PAP2 family protein [Cohnella pontilimi]TJY40753.1 phosphatase PAP2 family protein [Cohnella pontilimi]